MLNSNPKIVIVYLSHSYINCGKQQIPSRTNYNAFFCLKYNGSFATLSRKSFEQNKQITEICEI